MNENMLDESTRSRQGHINENLYVENSTHPITHTTCALCDRILWSDNEAVDLDSLNICGDCKFLFLDHLETNTPNSYHRRTPGSRRRRYNSSESIESLFSQQFSQMINLARHTQFTDNPSIDGDGAARSMQVTSTRTTTPSGSSRWRRVSSDTESDGFDSFYGESESNASLRRYRNFHVDGDTVSYTTYGGDSDASIDGNNLLEDENFAQPDSGSDRESDTDIDPMHAGRYQWNSEEDEDEDEDEDSDWDEVDTDLSRARAQHFSPESNRTLQMRIQETTQTRTADIFTNFRELEAQNHFGNARDYLDPGGFENLLEHLAGTDNSRRGAPPAAISFVDSLPRVIINENHDDLACAVCKDSLTVGTVVNRLPCFHLYHPSCILPWLSARNTCPLCRYELPTDDKDYEERKRNRDTGGVEIINAEHRDMNEDGYSDTWDGGVVDEISQLYGGIADEEPVVDRNNHVSDNSVRESPRNRRFLFAAAAPIVSILGVTLMLWLGKPLIGRWPSDRIRENSRSRRWWSLF